MSAQNNFNYHLTRTLKKLQDELDTVKSTKTKLEVVDRIDKLLWTSVKHEETRKLSEGWGGRNWD